uniref:Uncharacterized protein n=1 Tax=Opuntia streptacantha TaxID=393608 RepID=A0A7C9EDG3_OPUST
MRVGGYHARDGPDSETSGLYNHQRCRTNHIKGPGTRTQIPLGRELVSAGKQAKKERNSPNLQKKVLGYHLRKQLCTINRSLEKVENQVELKKSLKRVKGRDKSS